MVANVSARLALQLELFQALGNILAGEKVLPQRLVNAIQDHVGKHKFQKL
jgi:hypothetical protein